MLCLLFSPFQWGICGFTGFGHINVDETEVPLVSSLQKDRESEEVYADQPPGLMIPGSEERVYRWRKALYGLKQAPQAWNMKIVCLLYR